MKGMATAAPPTPCNVPKVDSMLVSMKTRRSSRGRVAPNASLICHSMCRLPERVSSNPIPLDSDPTNNNNVAT
jgi:hypothetical protein